MQCSKEYRTFGSSFFVDQTRRKFQIDNSNARILALFVKEKIFWLQITMDDVTGMAVVNCGQDLFDDVCDIFLAEELFLRDSLKKSPPLHNLKNTNVIAVQITSFSKLTQ